jgi:hypothetical protein
MAHVKLAALVGVKLDAVLRDTQRACQMRNVLALARHLLAI